ncbi:MAG: glycosyltransferase family 4 protein [Coleofasciculus sp. G1-WW12-02]|uniref:glycosyltransferase family 4 protein n=1 Tax=Coleofasciculus sp. G1-WW12-02 TaxID=3068483 RepID=UPI0032F866FF
MSVETSTPSTPIQVLMMPDYRIDNPYQTLLAKALELNGVRVHFPWGYRRVFPIFRVIKTSQQSFDIVHLHWLSPYIKGDRWLTKFVYSVKLLIDVLMTRWAGVRVVWTVHNRISHDSKFPRLELWTRRILAQLVDQIILHNYSTLDVIAQEYWFAPAKAEVIPIGHYRDIYCPLIDEQLARKELNLSPTGHIYLNQGMLRPYKGIERLLKVWRENQDVFENDILLIVGKPLDTAYGRKLNQLASRIKGVILYSEFVEDEKIHLFFSAATVVVLPFENILTSSSLVVAMSYGKPIIAPKLGGIPETLEIAGSLLYDPDDKQGLLQALIKTHNINLGELGQQVTEVCNKLDWLKIAAKTSKVYQMHLNPR